MTHRVTFYLNETTKYGFAVNEANARSIRLQIRNADLWLTFDALDDKERNVNLKFIQMISIEKKDTTQEEELRTWILESKERI